MTYAETQQQTPLQWGSFSGQQNPAQAFGLGQAAYGQPQQQYATGQQFGSGHMFGMPQQYGQQYGQQWGQSAQGFGFGQQRQLSQQDIGDVVRQLVTQLPQYLAQAQGMQPQAAFGWAQQRQLSQQDVNEVVRQILPIVPQIIGLLQGQPQTMGAAIYGQPQQFGSQSLNPFQQQGTSFGAWQTQPQMLAAFGSQGGLGQQRQLSQQDVNEVVRQLLTVIPQVIGGLQAGNQLRI